MTSVNLPMPFNGRKTTAEGAHCVDFFAGNLSYSGGQNILLNQRLNVIFLTKIEYWGNA